MSDFPTLASGAILQYPAQKAIQYSTRVLRFADGAEQRFRGYDQPLRRWIIRLDLLDEGELHMFREFFRTQGGTAGNVAFTDPWDGTKYSSCSLENGEMAETLTTESKCKTAFILRENRI